MKQPNKTYATKLFNSKAKKELRNKLRNSATNSEVLLWKHLRNKLLGGYKFRRQYGIGPFVVDFYSPELKLVVEVDGANHFFDEKSEKYDNSRQKFIEAKGVKVIRVTTTEVYQNMDGVLQAILDASKPPLGPSLERRGNDDRIKSKK